MSKAKAAVKRWDRPALAADIRLAVSELENMPDPDHSIAGTMETALSLLNLPRLEARFNDPPVPTEIGKPWPPPPTAEVHNLLERGKRAEAEAVLVRLYGEVPDSWAGILNGSQTWRARPHTEMDATNDKHRMTFDDPR